MTYKNFLTAVIDLANATTTDNVTLAKELATAELVEKAQHLLTVQNASDNRKAQARGTTTGNISAKTQEVIETLLRYLDSTPKTTADINALAGTAYTALTVSNAVRQMGGKVKSCKVVRDIIQSNGLKAQREYTAYTI